MPNRRTPPRGGRPPRNNRPSQRGGGGRPPRKPGEATGPGPGDRPKFTNRAAILLVVFALLVISYASSMRAYLHQRAHIQELNAEIAGFNSDIRSARAELKRWNDPAYVEQQARERFGWVLPGETAYQVLDSNGEPLTGKDKLADPSTIAHKPKQPDAWWVKIGDSAHAADQPKVLVPKPTPASNIGKDGKANQ